MPQLPVIAIIFDNELSLIFSEIFVKDFKLSLTNNCLDKFADLLILLTTAKDAPLLKDSFIKVFPSFFFPLKAKKMSFFLISLGFIDALLIFKFRAIFLLTSSIKMFVFQFLDKFLFFFYKSSYLIS